MNATGLIATGLIPGLLKPAVPTHAGLAMTDAVYAALWHHRNAVARDAATGLVRAVLTGTLPPDLRLRELDDRRARRGLRFGAESPFSSETFQNPPADEQARWLPCPACAAPLVWYEIRARGAAHGRPDGYRVCTAKPHHHARTAWTGLAAVLVLIPALTPAHARALLLVGRQPAESGGLRRVPARLRAAAAAELAHLGLVRFAPDTRTPGRRGPRTKRRVRLTIEGWRFLQDLQKLDQNLAQGDVPP